MIALAGGRLHRLDRRLVKDFNDFQSLATHGDTRIGSEGITLPLVGRSAADYVVHFLPLRANQQGPAFDDPRAEAALFFRLASVDMALGDGRLLARRYAFTPREIEVLQAIVEVRGVPQVAALLGISTRTAKAHLHSVFAKTGTDRQADLVKLVARFAAPI